MTETVAVPVLESREIFECQCRLCTEPQIIVKPKKGPQWMHRKAKAKCWDFAEDSLRKLVRTCSIGRKIL